MRSGCKTSTLLSYKRFCVCFKSGPECSGVWGTAQACSRAADECTSHGPASQSGKMQLLINVQTF